MQHAYDGRVDVVRHAREINSKAANSCARSVPVGFGGIGKGRGRHSDDEGRGQGCTVITAPVTVRTVTDRFGRGVPSRGGPGAPEPQAGQRGGQRQRLRAAGQLRHGQGDWPRADVHAVRHAALHGARGGDNEGLRAGRRLLEPGRHAVRNGGRPHAVLRPGPGVRVRQGPDRRVPNGRFVQSYVPGPHRGHRPSEPSVQRFFATPLPPAITDHSIRLENVYRSDQSDEIWLGFV